MRKLNLYFFGEEEAEWSDMLVYYGTFIVTLIMLVGLTLI